MLAGVFSCLYYERKLAVSQQTQELSVTRGRPQLLGGGARMGGAGECEEVGPISPACPSSGNYCHPQHSPASPEKGKG